MPKYVWTASVQLGNSVIKESVADDTEQSKALLLAEGYRDLVLVKDDVLAAASEGLPKSVRFRGKELHVSEADKLKYRGRPPSTFANAIWRGLVAGKAYSVAYFALLLLLAVMAYRLHERLDLVRIGILVFATLVFLIYVRLPSIYYARLHKAADWYCWDEC